MTSSFGWFDHSEKQRDRMLEVVSLFHEQGTVDELGIGSVRDAISDRLFPGLSVLHTRARYLLFVPWLAMRIERERVESRRAPDRFRQLEIRLINALIAGDAGSGIIGVDARDQLKRMPSLVYWGALRRFDILRHPGTRAQYLRSLDTFYRLRGLDTRDDEGNPSGLGVRANWHEGLPDEPTELLDEATFTLDPGEVDYLVERIVTRVPDSLFAHLLRTGVRADVDGPWEHPALATASPALQRDVEHARIFSMLMHGAILLYNLMLAEASAQMRGQAPDAESSVGDYRGRLAAWASEIQADPRGVGTWDLDDFWAMVRGQNHAVGSLTQGFVDRWARIVADGADGLADDQVARSLIRDREIQTKRGLARLANTRALERWSGASGLARLDFRWSGAAQQIVADLDGDSGSARRVA